MNRQTRLAAALAALCAGLTLSQPSAIAAEPAAVSARHFEISAQSLSGALRAFADQTGEQVVFFSEIGRDQRSAAVVGSFTPEQALNQLLRNTGLTFERLDARTIAITSSSAPLSSSGAPLGSIQPIRLAQAGAAQSNEPGASGASTADVTAVDEVVVRGARFHVDDPGTALKMPLSIKDTPQTVLAITGDVMDFASIKSFQDVYRVDPTGGSIHRTDNWTINFFRGFRQQSNNALKIDGFRLRADVNLDFAAFDRLELVKGSTSTMYGQNSVAGTLNAVSKMPKKQFAGELKAEAGSFDHYRVDADFTGPLDADGRLTYRAVAARLEENSFKDYAGKETTLLMPTLRYQVGEDTAVFARVIHENSDVIPQWGAGVQYLGDLFDGFANGFDPGLLVVPDLPRSHFNGARWNNSHFESTLVHAGIEHSFGNGWKLRAGAQHNEQNLIVAQEMAGFYQADGVPLFAWNERNDNHFKLDGAEVNLYGDVQAFGRTHTLFFGIDQSSLTNPLLYSSFDVSSPSVFDPTFNTAVAPTNALSDYTFFFQRRLEQENLGVTAQAFIRPIDGLTLLLGGRYSEDNNGDSTRVASALDDLDAAAFNVVDLDTEVFTMQSGITYALTPDLNVYASYGETYEPQTGLTALNTFADPEEGVAKEIGLKGSRSGRFSYSLALFDMERSNIAQSNPLAPGFVELIGKQRSRGVEAEFQGTVRPGWEVFASIGTMDAEFVDGDYAGYQPPEAPKFGATLFTSYEVQGGALNGYGIGGGVVHRSGRETFFTALGTDGLPIVFDFGDYTEVDLRLYRNTEKWRFQVSVTNLFDEKYYTSPPYNGFGFGVNVNPARTIIGQAIYRF
jgi:TonB-dependent siderophore receptor